MKAKPAAAAEAVERKLIRARTQLLLTQPFFGSLCLRLKLSPGPVPTMATDGRRIFYNPTFVDSLTPAEIEGTLAHEVMHAALAHQCRRGDRQRQIWNEAADYAITPILISNGFTLPEGVLVDSSFNDLSAEEIYARLMNRRSNDGSSAPQSPPTSTTSCGPGQQPGRPSPSTPDSQASDPDKGPSGQESFQGDAATAGESPLCEERPGGFGEVLDATDEDGHPASPAEKSRQQQEWAIFADQAIRSAKMCGLEPANLARPLEENRESKQDWRAILRDFVAATMPSDYRWTPPNRRYISRGLYLPSVERSGLGRIVVAVDTSGSIGTHELEQFAGEISAIADEVKPESIHVVYCDAAVQATEEFLPSDPIQLTPQGGGGTDFVPVFHWVAENGVDPVCLIYLTDLCCFSYPDEPEYRVLWVTSSRRTAPFGETVRI
jgi:predicted metal-dependent peptidase